MRHRKSGRKLGRNTSHRKALLKSLACNLLRTTADPEAPWRIVTTTAKAKELRPFIERLVTVGIGVSKRGVDGLADRRRLFAALRDDDAVRSLCGVVAERYASRPGGYTRVIRLSGVRLGDSGSQSLIEFV